MQLASRDAPFYVWQVSRTARICPIRAVSALAICTYVHTYLHPPAQPNKPLLMPANPCTCTLTLTSRASRAPRIAIRHQAAVVSGWIREPDGRDSRTLDGEYGHVHDALGHTTERYVLTLTCVIYMPTSAADTVTVRDTYAHQRPENEYIDRTHGRRQTHRRNEQKRTCRPPTPERRAPPMSDGDDVIPLV